MKIITYFDIKTAEQFILNLIESRNFIKKKIANLKIVSYNYLLPAFLGYESFDGGTYFN